MQSINIPFSTKAFRLSTKCWFIIFFTGQVLFTLYIIQFYWKSMIAGNPAKWNDVVPHIYSKDKPVVNTLFALHVLIAGMVSLMGPFTIYSHHTKTNAAASQDHWPHLCYFCLPYRAGWSFPYLAEGFG